MMSNTVEGPGGSKCSWIT